MKSRADRGGGDCHHCRGRVFDRERDALGQGYRRREGQGCEEDGEEGGTKEDEGCEGLGEIG